MSVLMKRLADPARSTSLRKTAALLLTGILAATIGVLTLAPINLPVNIGGGDKLHHLIAFAALVLPCAVLYRRVLVWLAPAALLYGGLIEFIQPALGRHGEWLDFVADSFGVALGVVLGLLLHSLLVARRSRRKMAIDRT